MASMYLSQLPYELSTVMTYVTVMLGIVATIHAILHIRIVTAVLYIAAIIALLTNHVALCVALILIGGMIGR